MRKFSSAISLLVLLVFTGCQDKNTDTLIILAASANFESPAKINSSLPFLTSHNSELLLSWVESNEDSTVLKFSTHSGDNWVTPNVIASGSDWFVNWADYPAIVQSGNDVISHYLQKSSTETFAYDVRVTQSNDNGLNWSDGFIPHNDGTLTEHGFVSMVPYSNGFFVTWLDGRNTGGGHGGNGHGGGGAMTIRGAVVTSEGELVDEVLLDEMVCDCCQTGAAITQNGPVVVYRDRTEEEIRDISIVRYVDGGWTAPQTVFADQWNIAGCPVNGPKVATLGSNLGVAWYTGADKKSVIKVTFSSDNGKNFHTTVLIDSAGAIGRVDMAFLNQNTAIVSWLKKSANGAEIKMAEISLDGTIKQTLTVAQSSTDRRSGFPQMEIIGNKVYFAWTKSVKGSPTQIEMAVVDMSDSSI